MQEWLYNNDILMNSIHNECKSGIAKRFIKTLKSKICKKLTASDSKYYLLYLNKLVHQCNNTYDPFINKKPINWDYAVSSEKIKTNSKASKGEYIKCVGGRAGGCCKFFKTKIVAQETIDLNIS